MSLERLRTDILILGSGGAGLFAALHALKANPGLDVTVASKGLLGKCGCTRMVQGGYNVALNLATRSSGISWTPSRAANGCHIRAGLTLVSTAVGACASSKRSAASDRNGRDAARQGFAGQSFDRTVHKGRSHRHRDHHRLMSRSGRADPAPRGAPRGAHSGGGRRAAGVLAIDIRTGALRFAAARAVLLATRRQLTMYRYHTPSGDKAWTGWRWRCARVRGCATWRWCSSIRLGRLPARTRA
jgi:fumarate reductase flavoprotein subunit